MKQINGIPFNIETDILGRITLKGKMFNRKDEILVKALVGVGHASEMF